MGRGQELLDAAREGHSRTVEKLLAQINKRSGPFTSLRRGAGPNVQDDNGYTPLHHACLNGHREIIHTLLIMGASPCTVDKKGATPLHLAAFKGDADAVDMLLEHHNPPVNVDQLTHDGDSALLIAAQFGFTSVVSQLIAKGADVTIKNVNGDSALDLAAHYGKYSVVRHLLHVRPQLVDQYMNRNIEYTSTPLHRASMNGRKEVVTALLDAGMDPNVRTANGTPLHEAARYGKASVVRVLLNKGADLHAMDSKKKTVYDLLAEYPEEALRKVRKVIREYVTNAASYDSDNEDLPPFPVPEYSPTPICNKLSPKLPANIPLRTKAFSTNLHDDKQKDNVSNARFHSKFPPSPKSPSRSSVNDTLNEDYRDRSNTFQNKANSNKQLKILGDSIKSNARNALLYDHQNQLIYELEKKMNPAGSEEINPVESSSEKETVYENVKNNIDRKRCNTLELLDMTASDVSETGSMKRKPKPLPKPTGSPIELKHDFGDDETDAMYVNNCFKKVEEDIYENVTQNISDDEKVKNAYADSPESDASPAYFPMDGIKRLHYQRSTIGHSCDNIETYDDVSYVKMEGKMLRERTLSNPDYLSVDRLRSDSVHVRGDIGCIYASDEYLYIYEINPKTLRGNAHPFIRKKEKATPMPCYCHEDPKREKRMCQKNKSKQSSGSQLVFYSCEDIYVPMNREDVYSSLKNLKIENVQLRRNFKNADESRDKVEANKQGSDENLSMSYKFNTLDSKSRALVKKKIVQVKQLLADWKTSEPQKNTNKHESLLSPPSSSLNKHHPQSFVKKLASKCLGLKAKFNSAPNISNSSSAEVDVKSKQPDHKNSTNTLLIGNSKFFKMLSKKEESGEIVCNDEFDTISLDRLGTLNRDSVVNRSNRSCPGFKTSLPNISENNELSDSQESISESVVITELDCDKVNSNINEAINYNTNFNIFEPRETSNRKSVISITSTESRHLVNECYESYEVFKSKSDSIITKPMPLPQPRPTTVEGKNTNEGTIYENIVIEVKSIPKPAARIHIPVKSVDEVQKQTLYENIALIERKQPEPQRRTLVPHNSNLSSLNKNMSSIDSRSSTMSSDSMVDETNLEDILLSEKSKSFKHRKTASFSNSSLQISRTQSFNSDASDVTEASALENVDCSCDIDEKAMYLSMTGTLPNKKTGDVAKKKVLFRHKTFTNIEVDRNSVKVKDLPEFNNEFLKETLAHYHIRGTGHCIYKAPTVKEYIYIFNRDTWYSDFPPFTKVPNTRRNSEFETAICFCRPRPPKFHSSAEDLIDKTNQVEHEKVVIDVEAIRNNREILSSSFKCYCVSKSCTLHSTRREAPANFVVKFSAIKKSISTPDITLDLSPYSTASKTNLPKNKSVPINLEEPYAVVSVEAIIARNTKQCESVKTPDSPVYTLMSQTSTVSSTTSAGPYSVKDIAEVISLSDHSTSTTTTLSRASGVQLPIRKSSSSEYSGHWSLQSCNSNVTIQSDASFKTCLEESSDDSDSDTLHSDAESSNPESSDAETVKSDVSTAKRPWVHSDSFRFGSKSKPEIDVILEESQSSPDDKSESSKYESGICLEGSVSSLSECEDDSGIPRVDADVSLGCASLERVSGLVGGVRSGSGRRRWDEAEGTSEGDALSVSSAASSCAPLHLSHHHPYSKVSPTPPKKPPRRNLSVSPTHANSPSSGYSYELRPHARSQDDLDDIQGAKHYLKHGRSVDQYVDGKLSYSEYEENHNSPRVAPIPNPRPSLKQPVAITAMYENVVIKEQNPRRKLRRNNFAPTHDNYEQRMSDGRVRNYVHQEKSSLESLLDDQSMNSPSDCELYYEGPRSDVPLSPSHYEQPPTPDHPPPSARQAENCIHERIRPLSQEYKRRSVLRDSQTETEVSLLRAASAASVASGATDRSGNTDNCVEEYVCDVPFAGLFKGSTTTLDGIGLRPMPAERPKTLRKLKSVYDASPTDAPPPPLHLSSNGQADRNINGMEEDVRRRSNTTSSTQSGEKSLSILSPFDEQEEWAKISEIMASFGSKLVRESVFVSELEQEFTSRLGLSCSESSLSPSVASSLGLWLSGIGLHDYESLFLESGFDDIDFVNGILDENDLREMGIEENDRQKIIESAKQLPLKITEISNNYNNNNISKSQNESVEEWLKNINLEQYSDTFRKHLYVDMDRVRRIWEVELTAVLEIQKAGHRKRILASVSGEHNGPANHIEDINADLNTLKSNIQQLKEEIKEKLPPSENLKPVPPPVVPSLAPPGGETLKRSKKNRPAPQPPRPSDLEIRAPSELMVGVPGALKTQWKHQPFVLVTGAVTYVANYLGSTVVKELRGTESTKKSIQKLKKSTKEPRTSPDIILSISYRGVKFLNTITRELVCEHEIRNIHCACQDADDLTHFAYITKDHASRSHYCHVFRVATMDQATEVILTLGEAFEVAYQMALREQSNRTRVTQSLAKTPTHDPMTTSNKEKPNVNHGRSHSITEIKLNGHQLKIAPLPASLSNEDFQAGSRNTDGSRSPRTPLLKAPIASTEEL